jgi:hypothetical protein
LGNLSRLSRAKTRSISPENFTGEKGKGGMATAGTGANAARDLGRGWKISPSIRIASKQTFTLAEIQGAGAIQHIWMTPTGNWRYSILRCTGMVRRILGGAPVGDFFASGWGKCCSAFFAGSQCESRQRLQLLLGNASAILP